MLKELHLKSHNIYSVTIFDVSPPEWCRNISNLNRRFLTGRQGWQHWLESTQIYKDIHCKSLHENYKVVATNKETILMKTTSGQDKDSTPIIVMGMWKDYGDSYGDIYLPKYLHGQMRLRPPFCCIMADKTNTVFLAFRCRH